MKTKTIRKVIGEKITEWLESIEDASVRELAAKNTIVTGGAIASVLLREPVNDFDLYFRNRETALAVAKYYVDRFEIKKKKTGIDCRIYVADGWRRDLFAEDYKPQDAADDRAKRVMVVVKSAGIASEDGTDRPYEYFEGSAVAENAGAYVGEVMNDPGEIAEAYEATEEAALRTEETEPGKRYRPVFLSTNAITLSNRIQIVLRFYGDPDEIHANYDFIHCTNYWRSWGDRADALVLKQPALEAILARELIYVGSKYPVCSLFRLRKFIRREWSINAGQILKIAMQISALNLTDIAVLEDQLTGVDCAYFIEVIGKLKEKDPEKVNAAYLVEIVDRMF